MLWSASHTAPIIIRIMRDHLPKHWRKKIYINITYCEYDRAKSNQHANSIRSRLKAIMRRKKTLKMLFFPPFFICMFWYSHFRHMRPKFMAIFFCHGFLFWYGNRSGMNLFWNLQSLVNYILPTIWCSDVFETSQEIHLAQTKDFYHKQNNFCF